MGRFLEGYFTFKFYWLTLSLLMLVIAYLYWPRGTFSHWKERLIEFKRRLKRGTIVTISILTSTALFLGAVILYNTNHLNTTGHQKKPKPYGMNMKRDTKNTNFVPNSTSLRSRPMWISSLSGKGHSEEALQIEK